MQKAQQQDQEMPSPSPQEDSAPVSIGENVETDAGFSATEVVAPVSWTASEYIAHDKSFGWYTTLGVVTALAAIVVFAVTRDTISTVVVAIIGLAFGVFAARKPHELNYSIQATGITIGQKTYPYNQLKSFSLAQDEQMRNIIVTPLQRFSLPIYIYYAPVDEDKIVNALANYLPYEERGHDPIDRIMKRIRF